MENKKYRIFILGAGFSRAAGLPLASELWPQIHERATSKYGTDSKFHQDLKDYLQYKRECEGEDVSVGKVDFEDFMRVLDIEHFLGLRGSDTWSVDGNEGTVIVKTLIGEILAEATPIPSKIPDLYLDFARQLQPDDYVLTFNYDTLLEDALDVVKKPYRLFPSRYTSVTPGMGFVDNSKAEVILLKMHGSINWFDRKQYGEMEANHRSHGLPTGPSHPIFCSRNPITISKILDGPRHADDPLGEMYRAHDIKQLYRKDLFSSPPWILTPSSVKILYADKLKDFWNGLGQAGALNFGLSIIGYSLPKHDEYARQALYTLATNYQRNYWETPPFENGPKKTPLTIIDLCKDSDQTSQLKERYRFVDWSRATLCADGLNENSLKIIFV